MTAKGLIRRNSRACLMFGMFLSMFFGTSYMTTYYLERGLSQAQIFILQTTLSLVVVLMDVPFGYLADKIGVRKVMIIGGSIMVVQSIGFSYCQYFWQFVLALVGTGLYVAAVSNTANSLMMQSLRQLKDEEEERRQYQLYQKAARRYSNIGYAFASLSAGLIVAVGGIQMPYILQPVVWLCVLVTALFTVDPPSKPGHISSDLIAKVLRMMLVDRRDVRYLVMFYAGIRLTMLLCFWVIQPRMAIAGIPQWLYGITYAVWAILASALSGVGKDVRIHKEPIPRMLLLYGPVFGVMVGGLTTGVWGFVVFMLGLLAITIYGDQALNTYLFEELSGDTMTQNTELAVASSAASLVFAFLAPFFGMLVDGVSLGSAFVVVAVVSLLFNGVSLWLFMRAVRSDV